MESEIDLTRLEENMPMLFKGVLKRAVSDYKLALKKKRKRAIERLQDFFYSDYCEQILDFIECDKDAFYEKLRRLEKQYA